MPTPLNRQQCVHYTGVLHNGTCLAGVEYDSVRADPGAPYQTYPCIHPEVNTCPKRQYPTEAEYEVAWEKAQDQVAKTLVAVAAVVEASEGMPRSCTGTILPCPVCGTGALKWVAYHRGNAGECTTEGCVKWRS